MLLKSTKVKVYVLWNNQMNGNNTTNQQWKPLLLSQKHRSTEQWKTVFVPKELWNEWLVFTAYMQAITNKKLFRVARGLIESGFITDPYGRDKEPYTKYPNETGDLFFSRARRSGNAPLVAYFMKMEHPVYGKVKVE